MSHIPDGHGHRESYDGTIRITAEELASPHVDDLLKRQASLRGEGGITSERRQKWYYRNWFVFMVAGTIGALLAWGVMEPYLNDLEYFQGTIEEIDTQAADLMPLLFEGEENDADMTAFMTVDGETILFFRETKLLDEERTPFDPKTVSEGDEIGVHVQCFGGRNPDTGAGEGLGIAAFVDPDPPPAVRTGRPLTLYEMATRQEWIGRLLFPLVAALVGLAIAAADGLICRLWRRVLIAGTVGLLVGFIGGFVSGILAELVYAPLTMMAMQQEGEGAGGLSTVGFMIQMGGRGLAWALAGVAMGLGQGIALRSSRLLLYGFLGGAIGGLLGGLLFDPIDLLLLGGEEKLSAHGARLVGIAVIGAGVGLMIGIVELLARDAWLNMVRGPLAGKEFLLFKDLLRLGASPRSDIYLFNDDQVADHHATIRAAADHYEIEAATDQAACLLLVNGRPVQRTRLRHGDQITLGSTEFVFQKRRTS